MAKLIDLTGQRFGKLLVIGRDLNTTKKGTYWLCQCDCGNTVSLRKDVLTRQQKPQTSCGCDLAERNSKAHLKDETGNRYGKLTVLYRVEGLNGRRTARWHCRCDCGNECDVDGAHLRNGSVQSCGCQRYESRNIIDEVGNRYGRLVVLEQGGKINSHITWICQCDCGNVVEVDGTHLRSGITKSCGCLSKEISSKIHRADRIGQKFGRLTVIACNEEKTKETHRAHWICRCDCGNIKTVSGQNLASGSVQSCGCLLSKGEFQITQLLQENNIPFQPQWTFPDLKGIGEGLLRFDFGVLDDNGNLSYLIEYDGKQHFEPLEVFGGEEGYKKYKIHDTMKDDYCKQHNIKLIRIKYNEEVTLSKILGREEDG